MSSSPTRNVLGALRAAGVFVIFLCAFGVATPNAAFAADSCADYTMDECTPEETCFELAGLPCGSQIGGQCAGLGVVACGYSNCEAGELTMICDFE